ncbi:MAG: hypothetical protein HON90_14565, partial [Halobacteriovoraceae bacterium]|nr:hypothetical protein [Halobacteriovoraceae bacterium]
ENSSKEGTEFLIKIPSWEPVPLKLQNDSLVVILDDDKFIHDTWNTKFNKWTQETGFNINLKEFYNPKELIDWISNNEIDYSKVVFLIDNDLGAEFEKGSNVINSLGIADLSFLVTNRYDDKHLVQHCKISKIRLMPKPVIFNLSIQEIS